MKNKNLFLLGLILLFFANSSTSQSLTGLQGLAMVPSAEMHESGRIIIGNSYFTPQYLAYGDYQYSAIAGYVSVTFLPFVELSFRYTRQLRPITRENNNFPDRMPSIRVRILKESQWIPALAIGVHDMSSVDGGGAKHFEATYLVLTKNLLLKNISSNLKINVGYGFALMPAKNHDLDGTFCGFSLEHPNFPSINYLLDYDSKNINAAVKIRLWKHIQIMPVLRGLDRLEGSITFLTTLK